MARIYRKALSDGLRLFINNRLVEPFDPTYWMQSARHARIPGLPETRSRLVNSWPDIQIPIEDGSDLSAPVPVRLICYRLRLGTIYLENSEERSSNL
jgi:hypothetical protein